MKKLGESDRLKAIARSPEYQKEYDDVFSIENWKMGTQAVATAMENLLQRWRLKIPIHKNLEDREDRTADEPLKEPLIDAIQRRGLAVKLVPEENPLPNTVLVRVDLIWTDEDLLDAFKHTLKKCKEPLLRNIRQRKKQKNGYDPWDIYDYVGRHYGHEQKKNWSKIARGLYSRYQTEQWAQEVVDKYAFNEQLKVVRKGVKKAYELAEQMIKSVAPS